MDTKNIYEAIKEATRQVYENSESENSESEIAKDIVRKSISVAKNWGFTVESENISSGDINFVNTIQVKLRVSTPQGKGSMRNLGPAFIEIMKKNHEINFYESYSEDNIFMCVWTTKSDGKHYSSDVSVKFLYTHEIIAMEIRAGMHMLE